MMIDAHGRKINYMRLSVTDRCNLRCRYCMPEDGIPRLPHGEILDRMRIVGTKQRRHRLREEPPGSSPPGMSRGGG